MLAVVGENLIKDFTMLSGLNFSLTTHRQNLFRGIELSLLYAFLGELGIYLPVELVQLLNDGVCEIWVPSDDVGTILFVGTGAFAKITEVALHQGRISDSEFKVLIALPSKSVHLGTNVLRSTLVTCRLKP
jgi:hypothetical protein